MPSSFLTWISDFLHGMISASNKGADSDTENRKRAETSGRQTDSAAEARSGASESEAAEGDASTQVCCDSEGRVHIAYRGVSDDRLYMVQNRKWSEVKYFRPVGLRVFCSNCRARLL